MGQDGNNVIQCLFVLVLGCLFMYIFKSRFPLNTLNKNKVTKINSFKYTLMSQQVRIFFPDNLIVIGNQQGWKWKVQGLRMGFHPALHGFVLPYLCPAPFPPCKILFRVNLLCNYYNYFNKTCFININILEITIKSVPSN